MPEMDDIVERVRAGECVLFLGAGVHAPPPKDPPSTWAYADAERPPFGGDLSQALAVESGFEADYRSEHGLDGAATVPREVLRNLPLMSQYYELRKSRQQLVQRVKGEVQSGKRPSPAVRALAELDFPLIITTNYDTLFEDSLRRAGKLPQVLCYQPEPGPNGTPDFDGDISPQEPGVFKIHGDIGSMNTLVLTDEDYIQFVLRMHAPENQHPVPLDCRFRLKKMPTLFIGYSLVDYNLRLLLNLLRHKVDPAKFPLSYSIDKYPNKMIQSVYQNQRRYVNFIAQDVWSFVPELYRRIKGREMPP